MFQFVERYTPTLSYESSQYEIEEAFSNSALRDELKANSELFANEYAEFFEYLSSNHSYANLDDLCYQVLASLVDPMLGENDLADGIYRDSVTPANFMKQLNVLHETIIKPRSEAGLHSPVLTPATLRVVMFQDLARYIATLKWMHENLESYHDRLDLATEILVALENVFLYTFSVPSRLEVVVHTDSKLNLFFEFNGTKTILQQNEIDAIYIDDVGIQKLMIFRNVLYVVFDFKIDSNVSMHTNLDITHMPLIEVPKDWSEYETGGYHTEVRSKPTKNRGIELLLDSALDALNILQHNKFQFNHFVSIEGYKAYLKAKLDAEYDHLDLVTASYKVRNIIRNTTSTFSYIIRDSSITRKDGFYFEFQYDFRGRVYSTGYNANLQSDSYHKAMLSPHPDMFQDERYTSKISNTKGY